MGHNVRTWTCHVRKNKKQCQPLTTRHVFPWLQDPTSTPGFCGTVSLVERLSGLADDARCLNLTQCRPGQVCIGGRCGCPQDTRPCPSVADPQYCYTGDICPNCTAPTSPDGVTPVSNGLCCSQQVVGWRCSCQSIPCPASWLA